METFCQDHHTTPDDVMIILGDSGINYWLSPKDEKLKEFQFTGTVNRDEGLDGILNLMERMNVVSFEKRNGYIWVKENDKVKAYN